MGFVVVYDACVLYPAPLRDLLLEIAISGLVSAKWTDAIHEEWIRNLLAKRPDLEGKLERTRVLMDKAVPDALVQDFESFATGQLLPDKDDQHVLATARKCGAQSIVTFNIKDFPARILAQYHIEAIHPDKFIEGQMGIDLKKVIACVKRIRARLNKPAISAESYIAIIADQKLPVTARRLSEYIDSI